jgi:hypothetical protein
MARIRFAGFLVVGLSLAFASCSGPGGNASVAPVTPGAIAVSGTNVSGNTITITCPPSDFSTFTISQAHYSGTFTVVSNSAVITVSPASGTSATTFTVTDPNAGSLTTTLTITGGGGVTGTPTVNATNGCG